MNNAATIERSSLLRQSGRYAIVLIRLYLGACMLLNGLNRFVAIFP